MSARIAIDAMGGDHVPHEVVAGAVQLTQRRKDIHVLLVGPEALLTETLAAHDTTDLPIEVVDAPEVIAMAESPAVAVKTKQRSSIHVGLALHKAGQADAFISAGNTGALMAASLFILGRIPGVSRPAVIGYYPTTKSYALLLDVGANVECKPELLLQFARMGSVYAERIMGRENPVVALMNVGEEPTKGNTLSKEAHKLLTAAEDLNFRGNIEGRDVMHHGADVVIHDGFVGNIILKIGESVATALPEMIAAEVEKQGLSAEERGLVFRVLHGVKQNFNYEEYGGTPFLGINGAVLSGHGSSKARAFERLLEVASEVAAQNLPTAIAEAMAG